jgi:hypothetical protein
LLQNIDRDVAGRRDKIRWTPERITPQFILKETPVSLPDGSGTMSLQDVDELRDVERWFGSEQNVDMINTTFLFDDFYVEVFRDGFKRRLDVRYQRFRRKYFLAVLHHDDQVVDQGKYCVASFI